MMPDSSHVVVAASTSAALAALTVAAAWTSAMAAIALICLMRSYRLPGGGEPGAAGLDRWGLVAMACQIGLGVLPVRRHADDPSLLPRAALAVSCGTAAAALAAWEMAARLRYRDRSPRVAATRRFLTYGPYRRMRRPRDLAALLLLVAINAVLLPPEALVPLCLVTVWAFAQRARWYDDAAAVVLGDEYEAYRDVVPLLFPGWRTRQRPGA